MRQTTKKLDSFSGGGYGNVFTQVMDVGFTYEELVIKLENIEVSQVTKVELILNGDAHISVPASHFADVREHLKFAAENDRIRINWRDLSLMTDQGQSMTALVTVPGDNLVLKVHVADRLTSKPDQTELVPGLSGYMKISGSRPVRKVLLRIVEEIAAAGKSGEVNIKTFQTGPQIRRAFFYHGGRMTNLRIKRNNIEIFDSEADDNNADLIQAGLDLVSDVYIFNPLMSGFGVFDGLETAGTKLEVMPTVSAPGDIPVILHTLENVANETASPMAALV